MRWFVIYTMHFHPHATRREVDSLKPAGGAWQEVAYDGYAGEIEGETPIYRRWAALLTNEEWETVCAEQLIDLEREACEPTLGTITRLGTLPAFVLNFNPMDWNTGGITDVLEAGMYVSPLPESDTDLDRAGELLGHSAPGSEHWEVELRCPDCASPEVERLSEPRDEQDMRCGNCDARFERSAAFLSVTDCEALLACPPQHARDGEIARRRSALKVLALEGAALTAAFGEEDEVSPLSPIPEALRPRLAELEDIVSPGATLTLARDREGCIVGLLDGCDVFESLYFTEDGRVARGGINLPLYVATVAELAPF